jgi:hypothetical protein
MEDWIARAINSAKNYIQKMLPSLKMLSAAVDGSPQARCRRRSAAVTSQSRTVPQLHFIEKIGGLLGGV